MDQSSFGQFFKGEGQRNWSRSLLETKSKKHERKRVLSPIYRGHSTLVQIFCCCCCSCCGNCYQKKKQKKLLKKEMEMKSEKCLAIRRSQSMVFFSVVLIVSVILLLIFMCLLLFGYFHTQMDKEKTTIPSLSSNQVVSGSYWIPYWLDYPTRRITTCWIFLGVVFLSFALCDE